MGFIYVWIRIRKNYLSITMGITTGVLPVRRKQYFVISRLRDWTSSPLSIRSFSRISFSYVARIPLRISLWTLIISCAWTNPRESMKIWPAIVRALVSSSRVNVRIPFSASISLSESVYPATIPIDELSTKNVSNVNLSVCFTKFLFWNMSISPVSNLSFPRRYPPSFTEMTSWGATSCERVAIG